MMRSAVVEARGVRSWVIAGLVFALMALPAPAAKAATPISAYGYLASFSGTSFPTGDSLFNAVAVDGSTGNILVPETYNSNTFANDVQVYASDPAAGGALLTTLDVSALGILPLNIAVDQSDGSLYIVDAASKAVYRFVSDGASVPTYTLDPSFTSPPGLLTLPGGVAVDPVTHDVLVADRDARRVYRLDTTGALVSSLDGSNTSGGVFASPGSLAVGPTGTLYVVDDQSGRVEQFSAAGASLGRLQVPAGGSPYVVAVNPQSGEIAVRSSRQGQTFIEGFTAAGQPAFSSRIPSQAPGDPVGLAWDSGTDRLYLNTTNGTVHTFVPATQPGLDTPVISQVTGTGAHAVAIVAPGGVTTAARIEYCPASAACSSFPVSDPSISGNPWVRLSDHVGLTSNGQETITDDLTGLNPNTTYNVRSSADNALTENTSVSITLKTLVVPPAVQTGPAGAVTDSQAELTGTIDTYGDQTTYHFEYGQTTNYGKSAPAGAEGIAGNSRALRTFSRAITGLQSGTTYHYRLVAHNSAGAAAGADRTFTTQGPDQVAPHRGYEQVSPVDKRGAVVATLGYQAAADGSAIEYVAIQAGTDVASAPLVPRYFSRRGASDWLDWQPLDPPQNVSRGITESAVQAMSPDFTHALVVSNRALTPGAIEYGGNLYIVDLRTGVYSLVGAGNGLSAYLSMAGTQSENMYLDGAPDFSWVVFASAAPLLPGVTAPALYKWTRAGGLELESRLSDGSVPSQPVSMPRTIGGKVTERMSSDDGNTMSFALGSFAQGGPEAGIYRRANGQTTAISVSQVPGDPTTPVAGELDGMSRDGRYVIFRSGRLTPGAPAVPSNGQWADLYQYDSANGDLTFIGTANGFDQLRVFGVSDDAQTVYFERIDPSDPSINDTVVWRQGALQQVTTDRPNAGPYGMAAFPSPNGRFLTYLGSGDGDVRLYDAATSQTVCVSCRPDGSVGGSAGLTGGDRNIGNRAPQVVTDDGTVFFDTPVRLVSADHNGTRDVYAYRAGRLTLISPGDGGFTARFADATPDGNSVFFSTEEPLVGQDTDQSVDLYVARVGGGFPGQSPPAPAASCAKTDCAEAGAGPVTSPPVVAPPQPPGPATTRSNQERTTLSLGKVSFGTKSVRISLRASQRGRVKVTGSRVSTTVRNVSKAGTYSITVPLSKKAQALRRSHKKFKVSVKVSLSGGWGSASAKYSRTLGK